MNWRSTSAVLAVSAALVGGAAHAAPGDCTISITPGSNAPSLDKIVRGTSGSTTFTLPTTGSVSQSPASGTAGAAILLHPGSVTGYPLHVTVNAGSNCKGNNIPIGLLIIAGSGPQFSGNRFYVHPTAGFANMSDLTVTTGTFNMSFSSSSANATATFNLGMDVSLTAASGAGAGTWTTKVTAQ
jgi:hypothetical protein